MNQLKIGSTFRKREFSVYWSSHRFIRGENWENFGDALVPFLINKISGADVCWKPIKNKSTKKVYLVIGSILELAGKKNIVWGAGIIKANSQISRTKILAVRGPISYSRVLASGMKMKKIWGDPALLLPFYFSAPKKSKSYKTLITPHYIDYDIAKKEFDGKKDLTFLDLKVGDIEGVISEIATADFIFSSSLHGLIVAHTYGVPAIWVKFSDKLDGDDIKFNDYFLSVGIRLYKPYLFTEGLLEKKFEKDIKLPDLKVLNQVQQNLLESCPFLK